MLVFSRQSDESIRVGDDIVITVVDIREDKVRLGIKAPREMPIYRDETWEAIKREAGSSNEDDASHETLSDASDNMSTSHASPPSQPPPILGSASSGGGRGSMLVLSRKKNESIVINDKVFVTVVEIRGDKVRLGVQSPMEMPVHRQEVYEAIMRENERQTQNFANKGVSLHTNANAAGGLSEPHSFPTQPPMSALAGGGGRAGRTEQKGEDLQATVEQLTSERDQLREKYDRVLDDLISAKRELLGLREALSHSDDTNTRMVECYEGVVRHCDGDEVVVAYEVENDIIEQTYRRDQFIDGNLPELNDQLSVLVRVANVRPDRLINTDAASEWHDDDGEPLSREF